MKLLRGLFLSSLICLAQAAPALAQEVGEGDVVRVNTSLVKVPVAVRDHRGTYVNDLTKEEFKVYEDGVEQRVAHFGGVDEPLSVVLLIDVSCSIVRPEDTRTAAITFIDQLRPQDSVLPIAFGKKIYALLTESSRDKALLRERIRLLPDNKETRCDGGTRLGDAVEMAIHNILNKGRGRRAVLLLTDGRDSKISKPGWGVRTLHDVSELGVPFYSLRLLGNNDPFFPGWPGDSGAEIAKLRLTNRDLDKYIDDLASFSGGRSFPTSEGETLKKYLAQVGEELHHQYLLAYYTNSSRDKEERRKIKVRVTRKNLSVRARDSYMYVPPPGK